MLLNSIYSIIKLDLQKSTLKIYVIILKLINVFVTRYGKKLIIVFIAP